MKGTSCATLILVGLVLLVMGKVSLQACVYIDKCTQIYLSLASSVIMVSFAESAIDDLTWFGIAFRQNNDTTAYFSVIGDDKLFSVQLPSLEHSLDSNSSFFPTSRVRGRTSNTKQTVYSESYSHFLQLHDERLSQDIAELAYIAGTNATFLNEGNTAHLSSINHLMLVKSITLMQKESEYSYCQHSPNASSIIAYRFRRNAMLSYKHQIVYHVCLIVTKLSMVIAIIALRKGIVVRNRLGTLLLVHITDSSTTIAALITEAMSLSITKREALSFERAVKFHTKTRLVYLYISILMTILLSFSYIFQLLKYYLLRSTLGIISTSNNLLTSDNSRAMKIYKFVFSRAGRLLQMVLLVVCAFLPFTIAVVVISRQHVDDALESGLVFRTIILLCAISIVIPALSIDLFICCVNYRKKRLYGVLAYFRSDPLLIRFEGMVAVCLGVLLSSFSVASILKKREWLYYLEIALNLIVSYLVYYGGISLCNEIYVRVKSWLNKSTIEGTNLIEQVLTDTTFLWMFKEYAKEEYSIENIALWEVLWKYKGTSGMKREKAQQIFDLFVDSSSTFEVNLPSSTVKEYKKMLEDFQDCQFIPFSHFDNLYFNCMKNISETFARFSTTERYKSYKKSLQIEEEVLSKAYSLSELTTQYTKLTDE